jgi:hypothetical protein
VLQDRIETPGGGSILFQRMQDHTAETIKSLKGCRIAWVEEAQTLSERSPSRAISTRFHACFSSIARAVTIASGTTTVAGIGYGHARPRR